jgi:hypothetical protein
MNNNIETQEPFDPITGEILESSEIQKTGEESLREAKKFLGLMEAFEIEAGNMESNMIKEKEKIIKEVTPEQYSEPQIVNSIIETDDLMSDFSLIRINLRKNIKSTSTLLEKFGQDLAASHAEDVSGQMLLGYSELIKSANTSMKLLIDTYSTVAKTQNEIKKLINLNKNLDNEIGDNIEDNSVTNIVNFVGTPAEMLASLKSKS